VLVTESKWNTSRLGTTKKGTIKQMSKRWILDKLKEAKPHNPHVKNYDQISTLVKKGIYTLLHYGMPLKKCLGLDAKVK